MQTHAGAPALDNLVRLKLMNSDKFTAEQKQKRFASKNVTNKTDFFDFDAEQVVSEPFQESARKVLVYR